MLPPPSVGGTEFSRASVGDAPSENATPIIPANGRSGNRAVTGPLAMTPRPSSTGVNTETLPRSMGSSAFGFTTSRSGITSSATIPSGAPPSDVAASAPLAMAGGNDTVGHAQVVGDWLDLEHVTGQCTFDENGAGDDVRPVDLEVAFRPRILGGDVDRVLQHALFVDAFVAEVAHRIATLVFQDAFMADQIHGHGLPGLHPHDRLVMNGGHVTPEDRIRRRLHVVGAGNVTDTGLQNRAAETGSVTCSPAFRGSCSGVIPTATGDGGADTQGTGSHRSFDEVPSTKAAFQYAGHGATVMYVPFSRGCGSGEVRGVHVGDVLRRSGANPMRRFLIGASSIEDARSTAVSLP